MNNKILGSWKLLSFYNETEDGKRTDLLGKKPFGYINYTPTHMSALLAHQDFNVENEKNLSGDYYISYGGKYEGDDKTVYHHVEICSDPSWIGRVLTRHYKVEGDILTIWAEEKVHGKWQSVKLEWQKA
jgi:hypothetical protein